MKIKSANIDISSGETDTVVQSINKYEPPVNATRVGRKYESKERILHGPYLEKMLFKNEIAHDPKTDGDLRIQYLYDFPSYELKKRFSKYKETIGTIRTKYNRNKLYSAQSPTLILSFCYNPEGRIVKDGTKYFQFLSFRDCYRRCLDYKVADPRFVSPEELEAIRSRINSGDPDWADWIVPTDKQISELETEIGIDPIYDCIKFLPYLTREATMDK